ncbi:MAG: nitrogenase [Butyrivibrio sp.]|nr:nitrogenase [Butyrivibrio sp.]
MGTINLDLPSVEIREIRLNSVGTYSGNAKELVKKSYDGSLKDVNRKFMQCNGCSITKAACMTVLIQDSVVIEHGPIGCSSCFHGFDFSYRSDAHLRGVENPTRRRIYSTNISEKDTVYGGSKKLEKTIREVYEQNKPSTIFVLSTCATAIVGDDIESVCVDAEEELGIPVVSITCEGFRSKVWTTGFDAAYHGIARKLIAKQETDEKNNKINVINFWGSDRFTDWFKPFGYEPNYIVPFSKVATLKDSSKSALTVQACSTLGSYLGACLEQEYGVPELETAPPYGIRQTDRWFRALGKALHQEEKAEEIIAEKKKEYLPKIEELRNKLQGKTAFVTGGAAHGHALTSVLGELGIKVVGTSIFHHDPLYDSQRLGNDQLNQRVTDYGNIGNYRVCCKQEYEIVNSLHRLMPDLFISRHHGMSLWGAKFGIPCIQIDDEHFCMGYEGLVDYGNRLLQVLENDEFVKTISKHASNPYTKWWFEQSPDTFIEGFEKKEEIEESDGGRKIG